MRFLEVPKPGPGLLSYLGGDTLSSPHGRLRSHPCPSNAPFRPLTLVGGAPTSCDAAGAGRVQMCLMPRVWATLESKCICGSQCPPLTWHTEGARLMSISDWMNELSSLQYNSWINLLKTTENTSYLLSNGWADANGKRKKINWAWIYLGKRNHHQQQQELL